jgi:outer membrane protein assembly factor BamB
MQSLFLRVLKQLPPILVSQPMNLFRTLATVMLSALSLQAADQPQWGQAWTRNMVSSERGLPAEFDPRTGQNIKWVAKLGNETHSTPIVANGRIYIGTNNKEPRDPKHVDDRGVLMCFEEKTGKLLWQLVVPKREEDKFHDWPNAGISSSATVEGDFVYIVDSRGAVLCLDVHGMANGNDGPFKDEGTYMVQKPMADSTNQITRAAQPETQNPKPETKLTPGPLDADIIWKFDLTAGAGIWSHDAAHSSILIRGNHLYLNSGTGVDNTHRKIRTPNAPSLVVFDKRSGAYLARDDEGIAPNIFHCTWSSPSMAEVNGRPTIFFCGGNGIVYGFEPLPADTKAAAKPLTLKKIFQFDIDPNAPKTEVHRFTQNRRESPSNIFGMPVFADGKLYVAGGGDIFWGKNEAWLKCIDVTKTGDITRTGEVWSYPLEKHVLSTPAVLNGLVFIADIGRKMHCVEAATGKPLWTDDIKGDAWASPYVADGKVYLATRSGNVYVWSAAKEKRLLHTLDLKIPSSSTFTAANGVLYFANHQNLYAIVAR